MIIGKLRHRVTIQQPVIARETDGGNDITYAGNITIWAQVREATQTESEIANKITLTSDNEVIVRYNLLTLAINAKSRLIWEDRQYLVTGIVDDERKIYRTIRVKLIQ